MVLNKIFHHASVLEKLPKTSTATEINSFHI